MAIGTTGIIEAASIGAIRAIGARGTMGTIRAIGPTGIIGAIGTRVEIGAMVRGSMKETHGVAIVTRKRKEPPLLLQQLVPLERV